jgi:hypothetical protein
MDVTIPGTTAGSCPQIRIKIERRYIQRQISQNTHSTAKREFNGA